MQCTSIKDDPLEGPLFLTTIFFLNRVISYAILQTEIIMSDPHIMSNRSGRPNFSVLWLPLGQKCTVFSKFQYLFYESLNIFFLVAVFLRPQLGCLLLVIYIINIFYVLIREARYLIILTATHISYLCTTLRLHSFMRPARKKCLMLRWIICILAEYTHGGIVP